MSYIISQVLAALAVIITFWGYIKNDKGNFLKYVLISNILYCIHYFFLDDLSFVIAIVMGSFRNIVFLKYVNSKRLVPMYILLLFEMLTVLSGLLAYSGLFSLIPIFQVCLYTYGVWQSNLRSMYSNYQEVGEELWSRFNAPKEKQSWYYSARLDAFDDMMGDECAENFYWEAQALYKDIYVAFYMDTEDGMLYQESAHGEKYCLPFNTVQWQEYDGEIPKSCVRIVRTLAERLEDNGSASIWMRHTCDCDDARYMLREDGSFIHTVVVKDGNVFFLIEGENQDGAIYGYWFDDMNTKRFFVQLRIVYGIESCLSDVLKTAFGGADGISRLLAFCNKHQVVYKRLIYSQNNGDECNLIQ